MGFSGSPVSAAQAPAIDAARKYVGVVGGQTGHREDLARLRIHERSRAVEAGAVKRVLDRFLQVVIDRQLHPLAFARFVLAERLNFAADAVDDDVAAAVRAHEVRVVDAFDAGLADDGAGLEVRVFGPVQLVFANLAHVSDHVCRETVVGILARGDLQHFDLRQFELPRLHRHDLGHRGVVDDQDRTEDRILARDGALNRLAHAIFGPADGLG